jgi:FkbM family methyltransferase
LRRARRRSRRALRSAGRAARRRGRRLSRRWLRREDSPVWGFARPLRLRVGIYHDPVERVLYALDRSLPGVSLVEVGANDGVSADPVHRFLKGPRWSGVLVEPGEPAYRALEVAYRGASGVRLEQVAIADRAGELDFFSLEPSPDLPDFASRLSSLSHEQLLRVAQRRVPDAERRIVATRVPVLTFDQLCDRHDIGAPDLLVVDAEGYDGKILLSIDWARHAPLLILYEHTNIEPDERRRCEAQLARHGYRVSAVPPTRFSRGIDSIALSERGARHERLRRAFESLGAPQRGASSD